MRLLDWGPLWLLVAGAALVVVVPVVILLVRRHRHRPDVGTPVLSRQEQLARFEGGTVRLPDSLRNRLKPLYPGDPRQAGSYVIMYRLGAGGMAEIFLGRSRTGQLAAIKIIAGQLMSDPENLARFEREAALIENLASPHSPRFLEAGLSEDGRPYIAIEYIDAPNLLEVIRMRGALDPVEAARIGLFIMHGIVAFHQQGVIHRDLKPANILYKVEPPVGPRVWIIDLGIAQPHDGTRLTQLDVVMGTVLYTAPERLTTDEITTAADVFSFGVLMYYICTKQQPFAADTPLETARRIREDQPDMSLVPRRLRPVISRCLEKDPRRRATTQQAFEMLQRIK